MIKFQIFSNRIEGHQQPKLKYGSIRNCEFIWLGPIFILITNRRRTTMRLLHPIQYRAWMKRCNAPFPSC
jgi:hypothetical protein